MATSTEKSTASIPGTENMEFTHETSLQRVSTYPIVKDSLSTAYTIVQSNALLANAYGRAETLSQAILERLQPIVEKLPIERVDNYANGALDLLEKQFPFVKQDTQVVVDKVRSPADNAYAFGKGYVEGVQSLANSATGDLQSRIVKTQENFNSLLSYIPRDQAGLQETYDTVTKELVNLRTSVTTQISELPATAQSAYQPVLDGLSEGISHFQTELSRKDITLTEKATGLTQYSKEKVVPLLAFLKDVILKKKAETEEVVEDGKDKVVEGKKKVSKKVEKTVDGA